MVYLPSSQFQSKFHCPRSFLQKFSILMTVILDIFYSLPFSPSPVAQDSHWWNSLCHCHRLDIGFASSCKPMIKRDLFWLPLTIYLNKLALTGNSRLNAANFKPPWMLIFFVFLLLFSLFEHLYWVAEILSHSFVICTYVSIFYFYPFIRSSLFSSLPPTSK